MLDPKARLNILKNLGVSLWAERNPFLFLDNPTVFARLAVLLSRPLLGQVSEQHKVLMGMLSVLGLKKEEYWLGWLQPEKEVFRQEDFWHTIQTWKPTNLLLLGQDWFAKLGLSEGEDMLQGIQVTFHPEELIKMPDKKKKAYQSLLNLKQTL